MLTPFACVLFIIRTRFEPHTRVGGPRHGQAARRAPYADDARMSESHQQGVQRGQEGEKRLRALHCGQARQFRYLERLEVLPDTLYRGIVQHLERALRRPSR